MDEECYPQTGIEWEAVQLPPAPRDEERVDEEAVGADQNALGADPHRKYLVRVPTSPIRAQSKGYARVPGEGQTSSREGPSGSGTASNRGSCRYRYPRSRLLHSAQMGSSAHLLQVCRASRG